MIKHLALFAFVIFSLSACNKKDKSADVASKYLNTSNLPEQTFNINTDKDTSVVTTDGIKLFIAAKSIESSSSNITLVVKEALTLDEMLEAHLTTKSDKGILSSDGMFDIYTKENATIKKAIRISVPTLSADAKMQLYKGKEEDGEITWQDPSPINKLTTPFTDTGKILFETSCASCHGIDKKLTGPELAWVDKRRPRQWIYGFTRNYAKMVAVTDTSSPDAYTCCIYNSNGKQAMNIFENLSDKEIDAIYTYIDKKAKELGVPENFNPNSECDSCEYYHKYCDSLIRKRALLVKDTPSGRFNSISSMPQSNLNDNSQKITPPSYKEDSYQFNID
jgi:cytochrome c2